MMGIMNIDAGFFMIMAILLPVLFIMWRDTIYEMLNRPAKRIKKEGSR
jgi:hypothetical protein